MARAVALANDVAILRKVLHCVRQTKQSGPVGLAELVPIFELAEHRLQRRRNRWSGTVVCHGLSPATRAGAQQSLSVASAQLVHAAMKHLNIGVASRRVAPSQKAQKNIDLDRRLTYVRRIAEQSVGLGG